MNWPIEPPKLASASALARCSAGAARPTALSTTENPAPLMPMPSRTPLASICTPSQFAAMTTTPAT